MYELCVCICLLLVLYLTFTYFIITYNLQTVTGYWNNYGSVAEVRLIGKPKQKMDKAVQHVYGFCPSALRCGFGKILIENLHIEFQLKFETLFGIRT